MRDSRCAFVYRGVGGKSSIASRLLLRAISRFSTLNIANITQEKGNRAEARWPVDVQPIDILMSPGSFNAPNRLTPSAVRRKVTALSCAAFADFQPTSVFFLKSTVAGY